MKETKKKEMHAIKEKYVNPFTDFGFKRLFGEEANKDLLIDFLNTLLEGKEVIKDLTFKKNEQLGKTEYDRKAIFDLYCDNEKGEKFIVELQKAKHNYFKDRALYYSTFPIQEQAEKGDKWNYKQKAVYLVAILDFIFEEDKNDKNKYKYEVKLSDIETNKVFYDKLTFIYLKMPKYTKTEEELETHFYKWLYVLRNLNKLERLPEKTKESIFEKFFEVAKIAKFTPTEQDEYHESLKNYWDLNGVIDTARGDGWKGGKEEGRKEEKIETARKMKNKGISIEDISEITGLTVHEVEKL